MGNSAIVRYWRTIPRTTTNFWARDGLPIVNPFLWALDFRTGGANDNPDALYFTAGYNNQHDGVFGEILSTPEPGTIALIFSGLSFLGAGRLLRRQKRRA